MKTTTIYKVLDARRTPGQRLATAMSTYAMLAFCIWLSQGSRFWTLVCGLIFLAGFIAQLNTWTKQRINEFDSVKQLQDWANSLDS